MERAVPRGHPAAVALVMALALATLPARGSDQILVKSPSLGGLDSLADALNKALGEVQVVELSRDEVAGRAQLVRAVGGQSVLFTVGTAATEAANGIGPPVVSLGVPNPARVRTAGAYVSIYPRLDAACRFLAGRLRVHTVGLLFSSMESREVAVAFLEAGNGAGLSVKPIAVKSDSEVVRSVKAVLPEIDALVLLTDSLVYKKENFTEVVAEARAARKPTVGFVDGGDRVGLTLTLVAPPSAVASAAVEAARSPVKVGKKRVEVEGMEATVSRKEAQALGIDAEALGAQRIR